MYKDLENWVEIQKLRYYSKKVAFLIPANLSSSTVRALIYKDLVKENNLNVSFHCLFSKKIQNFIRLTEKYRVLFLVSFVSSLIEKLYYHFLFLFFINSCNRYDLVVIIKFLQSKRIKKLKKRFKNKLIYDFDDAVWLNFSFGEKEFSDIIGLVDSVTSDNVFLADYARKYNPNSYVVTGPVEADSYNQLKFCKPDSDDKIIIGWLGSSSTLFYLYAVYEALEELGRRHKNIILKIVGSGDDKSILPLFENIKVETIPFYDQFTMISYVTTFDIAIYPLFKSVLSLGRGSLKAAIYMAAKVPVVCTAWGENINIIKNGENGFLANTVEDWISNLSDLVISKSLRTKIGNNGFDFVQKKYSTINCFEQLAHVINKTLE